MIVVARVSDHLSQSTCLEMLHPKTKKHMNPSVEVQRKVPTCPGKHLFVIRERLYAHPVYKYIKIYSLAQLSVNQLLLLRDMK